MYYRHNPSTLKITKRFTTVTCDRCTFTEIYRTKSSALGHVLDFYTQ